MQILQFDSNNVLATSKSCGCEILGLDNCLARGSVADITTLKLKSDFNNDLDHVFPQLLVFLIWLMAYIVPLAEISSDIRSGWIKIAASCLADGSLILHNMISI
jgi:hypothetical protein